jgi:class 3 adenylate cyclase
MGINVDKVIVGNLGTRRRIEYTVIGSGVNMAQRMESLATPGGILVTENTRAAYYRLLSGHSDDGRCGPGEIEFSFSEKKELEVKGYDRPIICYEIIF